MKIIFSMDNRTVFYKLGMVMALAVAFQACTPKINEIDNNQVISKPYSLYAGLEGGGIWNTNDGYSFNVGVKGADGVSVLGMATSGNNLIYYQQSLHVIEFSVGPNNNPVKAIGHLFAHPPTMFLDWPKYKRLYLAGSLPTSGGALVYSDSNGKSSAPWLVDGGMDVNASITSLTMLQSGRGFAYDANTQKLYWTDDPVTSTWTPASGTLPNKRFFISHIANTVLAIQDTTDIFYSTDDGTTWNQYTGIPAGTQNLCACAPFDQTVLVGTSGKGVYRLPLGKTAFVPSNVGMDANAKVRAIVAKYDFYKNDQRRQYVYAATDKGLYKSGDNGENWVKIKDELEFVSLF